MGDGIIRRIRQESYPSYEEVQRMGNKTRAILRFIGIALIVGVLVQSMDYAPWENALFILALIALTISLFK